MGNHNFQWGLKILSVNNWLVYLCLIMLHSDLDPYTNINNASVVMVTSLVLFYDSIQSYVVDADFSSFLPQVM